MKEPKLTKVELAALDLLIADLQESGQKQMLLPAGFVKVTRTVWRIVKKTAPYVTPAIVDNIIGILARKADGRSVKADDDVPESVSLEQLLELRNKHQR